MNTTPAPAARVALLTLRPGDTYIASGTEYVFIELKRTNALLALRSDLTKMFNAKATSLVVKTGTDYEALGKVLAAEADRIGTPTLRKGTPVKIVGSRRAADNGMVGRIDRINSKTYSITLGDDAWNKGTVPFAMIEQITEAEFAEAISRKVQDDLVEELAGPFTLMVQTDADDLSQCWKGNGVEYATMDEANDAADKLNAAAGGRIAYPSKSSTRHAQARANS